MNSTKGIVTLQFGNYANYVGAHWWNLQESGFSYNSDGSSSEEINHDVLYREGINHKRQTTFTPRLLLVDLEGSLKHLSKEGELYGNSIKRSHLDTEDENLKKLKDDVQHEENNLEVIQQPVAPKHKFQEDLDKMDVDLEASEYNLSQSIDSWADYLYARYHPRSVNIVKQFRHDSEKYPFDTYCLGESLWKTDLFEEDFCDKIRQYIEESDYLQGFQTIFDCYNGFGGLAAKCLEHLNDEYGRASFAIPVFAPKDIQFNGSDQATSDAIRTINTALVFKDLVEQASLFVPLSVNSKAWRRLSEAREFNNISFQSDNLYQTSAILASFLETMSIRYRLKEGTISNTLSAFCADMSHDQRKLAAAGLSLPFPMFNTEDLIDCLDKFDGNLFTPLTPNCDVGQSYVSQAVCIRGIPKDRLKRPFEQAKQQMNMTAYRCRNISEMFQFYFHSKYHNSISHVSAVSQPLATRLPFPREIFHESIDKSGFIDRLLKRSASDKVTSIPTLATVQSSTKIGGMLENLHLEASRLKSTKLYRFKIAGMETDDFAEALENLLQFKDKYDDDSWAL